MLLRYVAGLQNTEIAEALGISPGTVAATLSQAREQLSIVVGARRSTGMTDTIDLALEAALRNVFVRDEPGDWACRAGAAQAVAAALRTVRVAAVVAAATLLVVTQALGVTPGVGSLFGTSAPKPVRSVFARGFLGKDVDASTIRLGAQVRLQDGSLSATLDGAPAGARVDLHAVRGWLAEHPDRGLRFGTARNRRDMAHGIRSARSPEPTRELRPRRSRSVSGLARSARVRRRKGASRAGRPRRVGRRDSVGAATLRTTT